MSNNVNTQGNVRVPGRLKQTAIDEHGNLLPIAGASDIYDDDNNQWQKDLNATLLQFKDDQEVLNEELRNATSVAPSRPGPYDDEFNGMEKVYLTKNVEEDIETGIAHNYLTQSMFQREGEPIENAIFFINYDYELAEDITIPENSVLQFEGGSISAGSGENTGTITGQNTSINAGLVKIFNTDITLGGSWNVAEASPEWFGAKGDGKTDDTLPLQKSVDFCMSVIPNSVIGTNCTLNLQRKEYYFTELNIDNLIAVEGNQASLKNGTIYITGVFNQFKKTGYIRNCMMMDSYIIYGNTLDDFGPKHILDSIHFTSTGNPERAVTIRHNTWINRISNCYFRGYNVGIYFDYENALNSGSNIIVEKCVFYIGNVGIYVNGSVADGSHIHINDCDFEMLTTPILTQSGTGVTLFINTVNFEGCTDCIINNNGSNIYINGIWAFPPPNTFTGQMIKNSKGSIYIRNGIINFGSNWGEGARPANITGGKVLIDGNTVAINMNNWWSADGVSGAINIIPLHKIISSSDASDGVGTLQDGWLSPIYGGRGQDYIMKGRYSFFTIGVGGAIATSKMTVHAIQGDTIKSASYDFPMNNAGYGNIMVEVVRTPSCCTYKFFHNGELKHEEVSCNSYKLFDNDCRIRIIVDSRYWAWNNQITTLEVKA